MSQQAITKHIYTALSGRLARNIYFWICIGLFIYLLNMQAHAYNRSVYNIFKLITTLLLILLSYINNLILVPRLLARKKRLWYFLSAAILVLLVSTAYVLLFKLMHLHYPGINIYEVSFITSPVTNDNTLSGFLDDIPSFAVGIGGWTFIFTMAWYMQAYAQQEKRAKEAAHRQMQTELSLLRNQVNPHFLFNTLNNIYGLSLQKSDDAPESILKLSSIMRYMLYDADTALMPFEKEKEVMQAYIDMELLRLQKDNNFTFNIEADRNYNIPPLLWLPVLENIFKHGTRVISDYYFIHYSFTITHNNMHIVAENNYKETATNTIGGLGLSNLQKRLEILYPDNHSVTTSKDNNTFRIEVSVNLP